MYKATLTVKLLCMSFTEYIHGLTTFLDNDILDDVRMPLYLSYYSIPVLWWVCDATVGVMLNFYFSYPFDHVQTSIL